MIRHSPDLQQQTSQQMRLVPVLAETARWIWDQTDRWSYHHYVQARIEILFMGPPDKCHHL